MRHFIKLSADAQRVAADMKRRGMTVNAGDPLPANLPAALEQEIQAHLGWFRMAWHFAPQPARKG